MKVRARHGLFHDGAYHPAGEVFEVTIAGAEEVAPYTDPADRPTPESAAADAPKRTRKKKENE